MVKRQYRSAAFGHFSQQRSFVYIYHGPAVMLDQARQQRLDQSVTLRDWHIHCTWI